MRKQNGFIVIAGLIGAGVYVLVERSSGATQGLIAALVAGLGFLMLVLLVRLFVGR